VDLISRLTADLILQVSRELYCIVLLYSAGAKSILRLKCNPIACLLLSRLLAYYVYFFGLYIFLYGTISGVCEMYNLLLLKLYVAHSLACYLFYCTDDVIAL